MKHFCLKTEKSRLFYRSKCIKRQKEIWMCRVMKKNKLLNNAPGYLCSKKEIIDICFLISIYNLIKFIKIQHFRKIL